MFQRKLKNNVKNKLMRYEKNISTFENFIETAIELDNKLYERVMKQRHTKRQLDRVGNYINNCVFEASRKQRHNKTMFIKLNAMLSKNRKATKKNRLTKKKDTACYACDKKGHYARNCKSKNVIRRQLNMILRKELRAKTKKN